MCIYIYIYTHLSRINSKKNCGNRSRRSCRAKGFPALRSESIPVAWSFCGGSLRLRKSGGNSNMGYDVTPKSMVYKGNRWK